MSVPGTQPQAAPPPFHQQRRTSVGLTVALAVVIAATVVTGALVTVPTHARGAAIALDGGRSLVLLHPRLEGRTERGSEVELLFPGQPGSTARLVGIDGVLDGAGALTRYGLPRVALRGSAGPWSAVVVEAPADPPADDPAAGTTGSAVAEVGRRPLLAVFLGRGLEA